jgi:hypothetical protein
MRRALSWKSRARSSSRQPRVIAWVAAAQAEKVAKANASRRYCAEADNVVFDP